jgi:hypothetical protein
VYTRTVMAENMNGANMIPRFSLSLFADWSLLIELVVCICQEGTVQIGRRGWENIRGGSGRRDIGNQA